MVRTLSMAAWFWILVASAIAEENESQFFNEIRVPANTGFSTNLSDDGQALTVLLDNAWVELTPVKASRRGISGQTAMEHKVITLNVPYAGTKTKVTADVRGFVSTDAGTRGRLVICAGDSTEVIKLSAAKKQPVPLKGKLKDMLAAEQDTARVADYEARFTFEVSANAAKPVCQITLFLLIERDTDEPDSGSGLLAVDSLDLVLEQSPPTTQP